MTKGKFAPAIEQAAGSMNVSVRSVKTARFILEHGAPEVIQALERGSHSLNIASRLIKLAPNHSDQRDLIQFPKKKLCTLLNIIESDSHK